MTAITPHEQYTEMVGEIDAIRRCTKGSFSVKQNWDLLPHPSQANQNTPEQIQRYNQYKAGAEFPEFTKTTLSSMLAKLKIDDTDIDLDSRLEYLINDVDGDGVSLKGLIESCASNALQVKWHLLLTDYKGLSDVNISDLSRAEQAELKPRATINQYLRENVLDWSYSRINGCIQFTYLLLQEVGVKVDPVTFTKTSVISYLRLALDENGYYQQKGIDDAGVITWGDKNEVSVAGKRLKFIPAQIAADCELPNGSLPQELGFLSGIANLALYRYRVNADYKEALSAIQPTLHVFGMDKQDMDEFYKTNGRNSIAYGAFSPNIWPRAEIKVELLEPAMSLVQFNEFFDRNAAQVRAEGGVYNTVSTVTRTATEVINEASASVSNLTPLADSTESAVKVSILFAGMFEGIYSPDNIMGNLDDVVINMKRDFGASKLTVEEVRMYHEMVLSATLPIQEFHKVISAGGWLISDVEDIVGQIKETPTIIQD